MTDAERQPVQLPRYQLEVSRQYFETIVKPALMARLPAALERCAFGDFFGDSGSFGWDDGLSRDSDWGPRCLAILPDTDAGSLTSDLETIAAALPAMEAGTWRDRRPDDSAATAAIDGSRLQLTTMSRYFCYGDPPEEPRDWLELDEERLFAMVHGAIFSDRSGRFISRFARWRRARYPRDVFLARLARTLHQTAGHIAASDRLFARQDTIAMATSLGLALDQAMQVIFLLNGEWAPYYKWRHRAFASLPDIPDDMTRWLDQAANAPNGLKRVAALWKLNDLLRATLAQRGLVPSSGDDLTIMAARLEAQIEDPALRAAL